MSEIKRYKLITCEIMYREVCYCASQCKNIIDVTFMPKGLHDVGELKMSDKLQQEIDKVDVQKYEAILLCYGLCNNGVRNLHSKLPIVIPRAHDCITLLMGSKSKYTDYFNNNPGTFFRSPGWIERDVNPNDSEESVTSQLGINKTYLQYIEMYGEENAKYLIEMLGDWFKNYKKVTFIDTKVVTSDEYKELSKQQALEYQWEYEYLDGDTRLIYKLMNQEWNADEFLIVPPGHSIDASNTDEIVTYKPL